METDLSLINKVKSEKDCSALKELVERHSGIYIDMVDRYMPESLEGVSKSDILDDKNLCIYDAVLKFDESKKTKLSTYIGNLAKWRCKNLYNRFTKFSHYPVETDHTRLFSEELEIEEIESTETLNKILKFIDNTFDKRVKTIFHMRYSFGIYAKQNGSRKLTPWRIIAKKLDLSIQGCINIHDNFLENIKTNHEL